MSGIPLVATMQVAVVTVAVNAAYGGAGTLVNDSTDSIAVLLINTSNETIEYRVGSGTWTSLAVRDAVPLGINLSTTQVHLRMAQFARAGSAQLNITSLTGDYEAGSDAVELGGLSGGATAFTDLTDAPGTITANALIVGNADGTGVAFAPSNQLVIFSTGPTGEAVNDAFSLVSYTDSDYTAPGSTVSVNTAAVPLSDTGISSVSVQAESSAGGIYLTMAATAQGATLLTSFQKDSVSAFKMTGFDVVASDLTATMTVDAVQYSIAKAIKVKIGNDTYFWPLFGPVVP